MVAVNQPREATFATPVKARAPTARPDFQPLQHDVRPSSSTTLPAAMSSVVTANVSTTSPAFLANRPVFHHMAPKNWINDPCAPFYMPPRPDSNEPGRYHLFFQHVPDQPAFANTIGWGHASSETLVDWVTEDGVKVLSPNQTVTGGPEDETYDRQGVFTGAMYAFPPGTIDKLKAKAEGGNASTSTNASMASNSSSLGGYPDYIAAYTSVTVEPVIPYDPFSEGIALAFPIANATGERFRFEKYAHNPIVAASPIQNLTAFRDPFIGEWPEVDVAKGQEAGSGLYAVLGGGVNGVEPTVFLYSINRDSIDEWTYEGDLLRGVGAHYNRSRWSPEIGENYEVSNFLELSTQVAGENVTRSFLSFGAERCVDPPVRQVPNGTDGGHRRPCRHQVVVSGALVQHAPESDEVQGGISNSSQVTRMNYSVIGVSDSGNYYAQNGFFDPNINAHVAIGWSTEDDQSANKTAEQGWAGIHTLPRVLSLLAYENVTGTLKTSLANLTNFELYNETTLLTLGVTPHPNVSSELRNRADNHTSLANVTAGFNATNVPFISNTTSTNMTSRLLGDITSQTAIIEAKIRYNGSATSPAGIAFRHNADMSIATILQFDPTSESLYIDRSRSVPSSAAEDYDLRPEFSPFTLFKYGDKLEDLDVTLILDHGLVEVFVNNRSAITTRIYTGGDNSTNLASLVTGGQDAEFVSVEMWQGIKANMTALAD